MDIKVKVLDKVPSDQFVGFSYVEDSLRGEVSYVDVRCALWMLIDDGRVELDDGLRLTARTHGPQTIGFGSLSLRWSRYGERYRSTGREERINHYERR